MTQSKAKKIIAKDALTPEERLRLDVSKIVYKVVGNAGIFNRKQVGLLYKELSEKLNISIDTKEFIKNPTKNNLDRLIEEFLFIKSYKKAGKKNSIKPIIPPAPKRHNYPLNRSQMGMYALYKLDPLSSFYNTFRIQKICKNIDTVLFRKALREIILRHESLRTNIIEKNGQPRQIINALPGNIFRHFDLSKYSKSIKQKKERNIIDKICKAPFCLKTDNLFRCALIKLSPKDNTLITVLHHIISDGLSVNLLYHEISQLYSCYVNNEKPNLPKPAIQLKDYAEWENLNKKQLREQEKYWLRKFTGHLPRLKLPLDGPRSQNKNYHSGQTSISLDKILSDKITRYSQKQNVTVFIFLFAAVNVLLYRISGQDDIIVGTTSSERDFPELENTIGLLTNTLAIRNSIKNRQKFIDFLKQLKKNLLEAYENKNYPFDKIVEKINPPRDSGRSPIFDVMFQSNFEDIKRDKAEPDLFSGKKPRSKNPIHDNNPYDLRFIAARGQRDNFIITCKYKAEILNKSTMQIYLLIYKNIIADVLKDNKIISKINIWPPQALNRKKIKQPNGRKNTKNNYLIKSFELHAKNNAQQIAVSHGGGEITYKKLNEEADKLACFLKSRGVNTGRIVGVLSDRSIEAIISILSIFKTGGTYLPIDSSLPEERIINILNDSQTRIMLATNSALAGKSYLNLAKTQTRPARIHKTGPRPAIVDFSSIPTPNRSYINYDKYTKFIGQGGFNYYVSMQTSRGCPYACLYCHRIWPQKHVYRSAESIFDEINMYYKIGFRRFEFNDDIFNLNAKNGIRLFKLIIANKLKVQLLFSNGLRGDILSRDYIDLMIEAGAIFIGMALETASPRLQRLIGKNLNIEKFRANIEYIAVKYPHVILDLFTMHGFPTETEKEAMMTFDFIKSIKWLHFPSVLILRIFPNTDMEKFALAHGVSREDIVNSENLPFNQIPETLPFEKGFTKNYQARFINEYFLNKERLKSVLPHQMKVFTRSEIIQRYNNYFPFSISTFGELLKSLQLAPNELPKIKFLNKNCVIPKNLNTNLTKLFIIPKPEKNALRILLLDLSLLFTEEQSDHYDPNEVPLGLMHLLTYLHEKLGGRIEGKILKSRVDFDDYNGLIKCISNFNPDIIGIRTLSYYKEFFHKAVSATRQAGVTVPIIAGGPYATSSYKNMLQDKNIDLAVLGEGEITFTELINSIIKYKKKLPPKSVLKAIAGLAFAEDKKSKSRDIILMDSMEYLPIQGAANIKSVNKAANSAYIIYTSGSTGRPKGVVQTNKTLPNLVSWQIKDLKIKTNNITLQFAPLGFDVSLQEIFTTLCSGGKLVLIDEDERKDIIRLGKCIKNNKINLLFIPPALLQYFAEEIKRPKELFKTVKNIIAAGDKLRVTPEIKTLFKKVKNCRLYNQYGPTETHVTTNYLLNNDSAQWEEYPSVGHPIDNTQVFILDKNNQILPPCIPGELYISGDCLALGYWRDNEKTKLFFLPHPFINNKKIYKTGDVAKMRPDGSIEILGRYDNQVKIRGFRVEPGEVEENIKELKNIKEAIVLVKENIIVKEKILYSYYTTKDNKDIGYEKIKKFLKKKLPEYMVPVKYFYLEKLPLNNNGKLDMAALINLDKNFSMKERVVPPRGPVEERLAVIWREVLGKKRVSRFDNFFNLGGHSLNAIQLLTRINSLFNLNYPLKSVFEHSDFIDMSEDIKRLMLNLINNHEK